MNTVEVNEKKMGGVMVFKGTRVPVRNLFDYLKAGESVKDFLEDFPTVSFEQVREVLQKAETIVESESAA
ncbi:DUF433 domain-containing protein [Nitratifractor sp.]|uniref:DUF433 domain-containing protein n=1 Tax=Nitratifractor sp. TaxID=2268144 RepID=UPI0025EC70CB|nr:DUF433 domain-containing protein [Nitratifractor sp.]